MPIHSQVLPRDVHYFDKAAGLALKGELRVRVGCVAAVNNKLICGAFNTYRNDGRNTEYKNATHHAEHNCLLMIPERLLDRATIYIARLNVAGQTVASRPCNECLKALYWNSIREIVYQDHLSIVKERLD